MPPLGQHQCFFFFSFFSVAKISPNFKMKKMISTANLTYAKD
jgi:hypothetical protein